MQLLDIRQALLDICYALLDIRYGNLVSGKKIRHSAGECGIQYWISTFKTAF
jgi:hypothetical protein